MNKRNNRARNGIGRANYAPWWKQPKWIVPIILALIPVVIPAAKDIILAFIAQESTKAQESTNPNANETQVIEDFQVAGPRGGAGSKEKSWVSNEYVTRNEFEELKRGHEELSEIVKRIQQPLCAGK